MRTSFRWFTTVLLISGLGALSFILIAVVHIKFDPVAAGSLIVASATLAWTIYNDFNSNYRRQNLKVRIGALEVQLADGSDKLTNADIEDRRLAEYTARRDEAEKELAPYLPDNMRRAKRLINHERLYARIAEDRDIFGGNPELSHRHLAKWILIVEEWPRLGSALTRDPSKMTALEGAHDIPALQKVVNFAGIRATDQLFNVLTNDVKLAPLLERLVRFESAPPSPESGSSKSSE